MDIVDRLKISLDTTFEEMPYLTIKFEYQAAYDEIVRLREENEKLREGANYARQRIRQRVPVGRNGEFPDYILDDIVLKLEAALKKD